MSCNCGNIRCGVQGSIRMNDDSCVSREEWHKFKANYETLPNKQNQLIAGNNITLFNNRDNTTTISAIVPPAVDAYTKDETNSLLEEKQDKLTAGTNITIDENNVISASGGGGGETYTAGANIQISDTNVISATDTTYTAGTNITINDSNVISAIVNLSNYYNKAEVDDLIAGIEGLEMEVVSVLPATGASNKIYLLEVAGGGYEQWVYTGGQWVDLGSASVDLSDYYTKTETDTLLDNKQDKLTAGQGITISGNNTISSDAVAYTAGENVQISGNVISATDTKYTGGVDIQITPGNVINYIGSGGTPTKAELLTILGMQELNVVIKDDQGVEQTATVIGAFGTPPTPPTPTGLVMDYDNFSQNTTSWPDIHTCNVYEFVASWGQYTPVPINNYGAEIQLTLTGITLGGTQLGDLTGTSTIDGGILMASTGSTYDSLYGDVYFSVVASNADQDEITLVLHSSSGMEPTQPLSVDNINITVLDPGHN